MDVVGVAPERAAGDGEHLQASSGSATAAGPQSWIEEVLCSVRGRRKSHFYLLDGAGRRTLAAEAVERTPRHMIYVSVPSAPTMPLRAASPLPGAGAPAEAPPAPSGEPAASDAATDAAAAPLFQARSRHELVLWLETFLPARPRGTGANLPLATPSPAEFAGLAPLASVAPTGGDGAAGAGAGDPGSRAWTPEADEEGAGGRGSGNGSSPRALSSLLAASGHSAGPLGPAGAPAALLLRRPAPAAGMAGRPADWLGEPWRCKKKLKHYGAYQLAGAVVRVGDAVRVASDGSEGGARCNIALIEDLFLDKKSHKRARVRWFYAACEILGCAVPPPAPAPAELFWTEFTQSMRLECIDGQVAVVGAPASAGAAEAAPAAATAGGGGGAVEVKAEAKAEADAAPASAEPAAESADASVAVTAAAAAAAAVASASEAPPAGSSVAYLCRRQYDGSAVTPFDLQAFRGGLHQELLARLPGGQLPMAPPPGSKRPAPAAAGDDDDDGAEGEDDGGEETEAMEGGAGAAAVAGATGRSGNSGSEAETTFERKSPAGSSHMHPAEPPRSSAATTTAAAGLGGPHVGEEDGGGLPAVPRRKRRRGPGVDDDEAGSSRPQPPAGAAGRRAAAAAAAAALGAPAAAARPARGEGGGAARWLALGAPCETLCIDSGLRGCWFEGTILAVTKAGVPAVRVRFRDVRVGAEGEDDGSSEAHGGEGGLLEEWVPLRPAVWPGPRRALLAAGAGAAPGAAARPLGHRSRVRPVPPPAPPGASSARAWAPGAAVDVRWHDGFWDGCLVGPALPSGRLAVVYLMGEGEAVAVPWDALRPSLEWAGSPARWQSADASWALAEGMRQALAQGLVWMGGNGAGPASGSASAPMSPARFASGQLSMLGGFSLPLAGPRAHLGPDSRVGSSLANNAPS